MTHFSSYYYMTNKIIVVFISLALEMWHRKISLKNKKSHYLKKIFAAFNYNKFSTRMNCEVDQMA